MLWPRNTHLVCKERKIKSVCKDRRFVWRGIDLEFRDFIIYKRGTFKSNYIVWG